MDEDNEYTQVTQRVADYLENRDNEYTQVRHLLNDLVEQSRNNDSFDVDIPARAQAADYIKELEELGILEKADKDHPKEETKYRLSDEFREQLDQQTDQYIDDLKDSLGGLGDAYDRVKERIEQETGRDLPDLDDISEAYDQFKEDLDPEEREQLEELEEKLYDQDDDS